MVFSQLNSQQNILPVLNLLGDPTEWRREFTILIYFMKLKNIRLKFNKKLSQFTSKHFYQMLPKTASFIVSKERFEL
jgi:hypothetical protein